MGGGGRSFHSLQFRSLVVEGEEGNVLPVSLRVVAVAFSGSDHPGTPAR